METREGLLKDRKVGRRRAEICGIRKPQCTGRSVKGGACPCCDGPSINVWWSQGEKSLSLPVLARIWGTQATDLFHSSNEMETLNDLTCSRSQRRHCFPRLGTKRRPWIMCYGAAEKGNNGEKECSSVGLHSHKPTFPYTPFFYRSVR